MKKRISCLLLSICFLCGFGVDFANAQKRFTQFSSSPADYLSNLKELYESDRNMKKEVQKDFEQLIERYTDVWLKHSNLQQKELIDLSNQMLKSRLRPYPDFYSFLETQIAFDAAAHSKESRNQWIKGLEMLLKNKKTKQFTISVERSLSLLKENVLYGSNTVTWTTTAKDYTFRSDSTQGIYVIFPSPMQLTYSSQKDASTIEGTTGTYNIGEEAWYGKGGKVYWTKTGLDKNKVWAELHDYSASIRRSAVQADSVRFLNTDYFPKPIYGQLQDVCGDKLEGVEARYPMFISYKKEETIKNIAPSVDYIGGFTMQGGNFVGSGTSKEPAILRFYKEGKLFAQTNAIEYSIRPERILAKDAYVIFYMDSDSIYHPGLSVRYTPSDKSLVCSSDKTGITSSPWVDSYHKIDIYTEAVYANLNDYFMDFTAVKGPGKRESKTIFESERYYSKARYEQLQGLDEVHPLYRIREYCKLIDTNAFTVDEYARYTKMDRTQIKFLLMNLASNGFLVYEGYREVVFMKPKVNNYIRSAAGLQDYDAIRITSSIAGTPNAQLNLLNKDLRMNGIGPFTLSDTHNVTIQPLNGEMVMKKNRDFIFDGRIIAGRFDMHGKECNFSYDEFKLKLPQIDTLVFYVPMFDDTNTLIKTRTALQHVDCELLIDSPKNKASLKKLPEYPILTSLKPCYAYYDVNNLQGEVYHRDRFFYTLEPFQIKSLFSFKTETLELKGELSSAGIFPTIKEPLKVMPDYSLGFKIHTPEAGYPIYGGKGQYYQSIDLSNNGFLGTGRLDYVASVSHSKKFIFMPDSMHCETEKFNCADAASGKSGMGFPLVSVSKTQERWYPYQDKMYVHQAAEPFFMYGGEALHKGYLLVEPSGLSGAGESKVGELLVASQHFKFRQEQFTADTSNMQVLAIARDDIAYKSRNVKTAVDFKTRKAHFVSNDGVQEAEFPYLQYVCHVDKSEWGLDSKDLSVSNSQSISNAGFAQMTLRELISRPQPGAVFVSTHPQQHHLQFNAGKANLNLKANCLHVENVYLIHVSDIVVGPGGNALNIYPGALMDTIEDCKILMDTLTRIHEIEKARVFISGAYHYNANGAIVYTDEMGNKQLIFMHTITPTNGVSKGFAEITAANDFKLSPAFRFKGKMEVTASDTAYLFDGGAQITFVCAAVAEEPAWLKFRFKINPKQIAIPLTETAVDADGDHLIAAIAYDPQNLLPSSAFLSTRKIGDAAFISSTGLLSYNKSTKSYEITTQTEEADEEKTTIPAMTYNPSTCKVKSQGILSLGMDIAGVTVKAYGDMAITEGKEEAAIAASVKFNFPFAQQAIDYMGLELYEDMNLTAIELEKPYIKEQIFGQCGKKSEEIYQQLIQVGEWEKIPEELQSTLYITRVNLQWDPVLRSFISNGDIELGMVGKKQVNKIVKGKMQVLRNRIGAEIRLYIEADHDHWYYFQFEGSTLKAVSSLDNFNEMITAVPVRDREFKYANNRHFRYGPASTSDKRRFIRKVEFKESGMEDQDDTQEKETKTDQADENDKTE